MIVCTYRRLSGKGDPLDLAYGQEWIYLGYSYNNYLKLCERFGQSQAMRSFNKQMLKRINRCRKNFLVHMDIVSKANEDIYWHLTESAENEAMDNHLFLDYCYVSVLAEVAGQASEDILVIVEGPDLFQVLKDHLGEMTGVPLRFLDSETNGFRTRWRCAVSAGRNALGFLRRALYRKVCLALYRKRPGIALAAERASVLVHVFANDAAFGKDGAFHDAYMGKFVEPIKASGRDILYVLHTGYAAMGLREIIRWVNQSDLKAVFLEELISMKDLVKALFVPLKLKKAALETQPAADRAFKALILRSLKREMRGGAYRLYYLYYFFMKRLSEKGLTISHYLDVYEGHILERIMRLGARHYLPRCRILGFCHMAFSKNHISLFSGLRAGSTDLRPDTVFCTGQGYRDVLVANGFGEENVKVVGDLRGGALGGYLYPLQRIAETRDRVLVALPLSESDAQELFWKAVQAYRETPYRVRIYKHPMMHLDTLLGLLDESLPANIDIAKEPTSSGLKDCDLVLTTGSTVSVNAMNMGLPVISLRKEIGLTFEPLDWFDAPIAYCTSPEEVRATTERLLAQSINEYEQYRNEAIALSNSCLSPHIDMAAIQAVFSREHPQGVPSIHG